MIFRVKNASFRFSTVLLELVEKEELPFYARVRRLTAKELKLRKRKADKEAQEADEMAKEMGLGGVSYYTIARPATNVLLLPVGI